MLAFRHILTLALFTLTAAQSNVTVSLDGNCGPDHPDVTCLGSVFGGCCSAYGKCGSTFDHCGAGCQLSYGHCEDTTGKPSPDGTCGGTIGFTCKGSEFGDCCSQYQFCGSSKDYCGEGCMPGFGDCASNSSVTPSPKKKAKPTCADLTHTTTVWIAEATPTTARNSSDLSSSLAGKHTKGSKGSKSSKSSSRSTLSSSVFAKPTAASNGTTLSSSVAATSTSADFIETEAPCVPCEGQNGTLPYCGADVHTNNYEFTPKTCRTVYYELDITNTTMSPDGMERLALTVNGQMPGPLIEANWGDTVVVKVNNKLQNNGTSIHFHGIRQLDNSEYDGVPSITQCPIAPGDSLVYKWRATNYGTSWYHSHYAIQAWMGVFGPMVIHGPTSKDFDIDVGTVFLNDWTHTPVDEMFDMEQDAVHGGPRSMDNGLMNGKNTWGVEGTANQTGERHELQDKFEPGKTYLLRIINGAIQSNYKFQIDGHQLEVINMDFTAIEPYTTDTLSIGIGQRYMVLVKANQTPGNYWMRADSQNACGHTLQADDIKGIIRYAGSNNTDDVPTSTPHAYVGGCRDEPLTSLVPMVKLNPVHSDVEYVKEVTVGVSDFLYKWSLSGTSFMSHYEDPTLVHVLDNGVAPTTSGNLILDLPEMGKWVYIVIESAIPLNHPIHLHGHDFFVLAAGQGTYNSSTPLNLVNPPRRDTANMPGGGYLVVAFKTDNPGTWLMHCHIGWHTSMGFALQIVEGKSMIGDTVKDGDVLRDTCKKWTDWTGGVGFSQMDSGV